MCLSHSERLKHTPKTLYKLLDTHAAPPPTNTKTEKETPTTKFKMTLRLPRPPTPESAELDMANWRLFYSIKF